MAQTKTHFVIGCVLLVWALSCCLCTACPRTPPDTLAHGRRTRGDNQFRLIIGNEPAGYEPGKIYNLFLLGTRTHTRLQQFTHFKLTAGAAAARTTKPNAATVASPRRVGRFQLFGDALTKFNEACINTVSEADDLPKTEIQVMWVAPASGSGCVSLSAMVYEPSGKWYADDGALTKMMCEIPKARTQASECCACDEAKYTMVFEGIWSNETHPKDYPFAIWLTHFSDIIGASHDSNFTFWGENHIASDGFRSLAEWGSVRQMEIELRAKGPRLRTLIKAAGLWYPDVNTNTTSNFRVDRKNHKISFVTMFGPSPDWVVGVSGLNLCKKDCTWEERLDLDLYPWDAGTDSGISYMSPNAETQPRERMHPITTMYPEDPRSPFYDPEAHGKMTPLARAYLRREKVITKNCDADFLEAQLLDESDNAEVEAREECMTTAYSVWSPCSVTCGKGLRMRSRQYKNPQQAGASSCKQQLISKEMCVAAVPECEGAADDDREEDLGASNILSTDDGEGTGICRTTKWSPMSECSTTCGVGISMRTRTFIDHMGRKKCPHISVVEKEKCMRPECSIADIELPDPMCPATQWSDWSPCSVSCGRGVKIRTRLLLVGPEMQAKCAERLELNQQKPCADLQDCVFDMATAKEICSEPIEVGPCRASLNRFTYNSAKGMCVLFAYGGCRGNRNNFLTETDCMQTCQATVTPQAVPLNIVDCQLSEWSPWTPCNASCGIGYSERRRTVLRQSQNGGIACPTKLLKRKRCSMSPCQ